jgi:hypothetical protein
MRGQCGSTCGGKRAGKARMRVATRLGRLAVVGDGEAGLQEERDGQRNRNANKPDLQRRRMRQTHACALWMAQRTYDEAIDRHLLVGEGGAHVVGHAIREVR